MKAKFLTLPILFALMIFTQLTYAQTTVGIGSDVLLSRLFFATNEIYFDDFENIKTNIYTIESSKKYNWGFQPGVYFQNKVNPKLVFEFGIAFGFIKDEMLIHEEFVWGNLPYTSEEFEAIVDSYEFDFSNIINPEFSFPNIDTLLTVEMKQMSFNIPLSFNYLVRLTNRSNLILKAGITPQFFISKQLNTDHVFHDYNIENNKTIKLLQASANFAIGQRIYWKQRYFDILFQSSTSLFPISNLKKFKPYDDLPSVDIPPLNRRSFGVQLKYFFREL